MVQNSAAPPDAANAVRGGRDGIVSGEPGSQLRSKEDRLVEIAASLRVGERVRVGELAKRYDVSEVTIRSDLDTLEQRKVITRVRGGAIRVAGGSAALSQSYESEFAHELTVSAETKKELAEEAARLVSDDDAILLDDSPVCSFLADTLLRTRARLLIATNSLPIASRLMLKESFRVVMPGGPLRRSTESVSGSLSDAFSGNVRFRLGFFGPAAFDPQHGMLELDMTQATVKREMIAHCDTVVSMVESPRFAAFGTHATAGLDQIGHLICDQDVSPRLLRQLRARQVDVVVAEA